MGDRVVVRGVGLVAVVGVGVGMGFMLWDLGMAIVKVLIVVVGGGSR